MLKKTIKYIDFDGVEREEDFYFHLNKAELTKWLMMSGGYTLDKVLERLYKEQNTKKIIEIFDDLIKRSYGVKSIDGRQFIKNEEVWNAFYQSEAYSIVFMDLVGDAKKAANFINQVIPSDISDSIKDIIKNNTDGLPDEIKDIVKNNPELLD